MNRIVLGLGSNTPEAEANIHKAILFLSERFPDLIHSSVYKTEPEGDAVPGTQYYNAVAKASTDLSTYEVISMLKAYETENGRSQVLKEKGIIPIDIDLVIHGEIILRPHEINCNYFRIGADEIKI